VRRRRIVIAASGRAIAEPDTHADTDTDTDTSANADLIFQS
jgi:hypothetical protein